MKIEILEDLNKKWKKEWEVKRRKKLKRLAINTIIMMSLIIYYLVKDGYEFLTLLTFLNTYGLMVIMNLDGFNTPPSHITITDGDDKIE